jgi:hypothetical protein
MKFRQNERSGFQRGAADLTGINLFFCPELRAISFDSPCAQRLAPFSLSFFQLILLP